MSLVYHSFRRTVIPAFGKRKNKYLDVFAKNIRSVFSCPAALPDV